MHKTADAADAFRHERHLVVVEHGLGELLDAPVAEEAAVITTHDLLAFYKQAEIRRLFERRIERTDAQDRRFLFVFFGLAQRRLYLGHARAA